MRLTANYSATQILTKDLVTICRTFTNEKQRTEVADQIKKMILRNFSQVPNSFTGNKHSESDYTVHRTPTWLASYVWLPNE
ncbi:MAG: hypothetical protein ACLUDY_04910 [Bacteroides xylanisolvens]